LLDARGVLGRDERMANIIKISKLSEKIARGYLQQRIEMEFPLLEKSVREETVKAYREKYLAPEEK
jgi:glycyl-tRNA synthetase alpha subunit